MFELKNVFSLLHCFYLIFQDKKKVCKVKMTLNKLRKLSFLRVVFLLTATSHSMTVPLKVASVTFAHQEAPKNTWEFVPLA